MEYVVFIDESSITAHRFRSLSAFSFPIKHYCKVNETVARILASSGVSEFKWSKLKNARNFFCAKKIVEFVIRHIPTYEFRLDSIVWDTQDSRHEVRGRDDTANYERMFYHLLNNTMKMRPKGGIWDVRPDQKNDIDWATIHECLSHTGAKRSFKNTIFGAFFSDRFFNIRSFEEQESHKEYLVQVADLFSGLSVFPRKHYDKYLVWKTKEQKQMTLDFGMGERPKLSNSQAVRSELLDFFIRKCRKYKLGVSLKTNRHLTTFRKTNPINFWTYTPQGDYDKAPTR